MINELIVEGVKVEADVNRAFGVELIGDNHIIAFHPVSKERDWTSSEFKTLLSGFSGVFTVAKVTPRLFAELEKPTYEELEKALDFICKHMSDTNLYTVINRKPSDTSDKIKAKILSKVRE